MAPGRQQLGRRAFSLLGLRRRRSLLLPQWQLLRLSSVVHKHACCTAVLLAGSCSLVAGSWLVNTKLARCDNASSGVELPPPLLSDELVSAAKRGRIDMIATAVEPDPSLQRSKTAPLPVDARAVGGRTVLSHAAEREATLDLCRWMLEHGADPNSLDQRGRSALAVAAWRGCVQTVLLLLRHGASPVIYDVYGLAPLHKAAGFGHTWVVKALLQVGKVSPDLLTVAVTAPTSHEAQPSKYETAMHIAARVGHEGVIDALLREGADPNTKNAHGDTPLHCACSRRHLRTVRRLLCGGAKIDLCNNAGVAPCDAAHAGWVLSKLVETGVLKRVPTGMLGPDRLGDSDFGG